MHITRYRAIAAATAAVIALTATAVPAAASPYRHRDPGAAVVLGAVAGLFGTIAAIAARDHYARHYEPYYGPYAPPPPPPVPYGYGYPYRY